MIQILSRLKLLYSVIPSLCSLEIQTVLELKWNCNLPSCDVSDELPRTRSPLNKKFISLSTILFQLKSMTVIWCYHVRHDGTNNTLNLWIRRLKCRSKHYRMGDHISSNCHNTMHKLSSEYCGKQIYVDLKLITGQV